MVDAENQGMDHVKHEGVDSLTDDKAVGGLHAVRVVIIFGRSSVSIVFTSNVGLDAVISGEQPAV